MTEPTERDREMAWAAVKAWSPTADHDALPIVIAVTRAITAAREEGRLEERERWEAWEERLRENSDAVPGLIGLMWRFPPPRENATVLDLSGATQGIPGLKELKMGQD